MWCRHTYKEEKFLKFQGKKLVLVLCLVVAFMSVMLTGCGSSSSSSVDSASSTTIEETTTDTAASTSETTKDKSGLLGSAATKSEKTDSAQPAPAGTKTFENAKYGIKFNYPEAWTTTEGSSGLIVMFVTNQTDPKKVASLNLAVEELPKGITLDDYNKTAEGQLKSAISGFKLLNTSRISVGDNKAVSIEYVGEQQGVNLSCLSTFFVRDGKAFVFTFAGVEAGYASVLPDVKNLFKSVSFK